METINLKIPSASGAIEITITRPLKNENNKEAPPKIEVVKTGKQDYDAHMPYVNRKGNVTTAPELPPGHFSLPPLSLSPELTSILGNDGVISGLTTSS